LRGVPLAGRPGSQSVPTLRAIARLARHHGSCPPKLFDAMPPTAQQWCCSSCGFWHAQKYKQCGWCKKKSYKERSNSEQPPSSGAKQRGRSGSRSKPSRSAKSPSERGPAASGWQHWPPSDDVQPPRSYADVASAYVQPRAWQPRPAVVASGATAGAAGYNGSLWATFDPEEDADDDVEVLPDVVADAALTSAEAQQARKIHHGNLKSARKRLGYDIDDSVVAELGATLDTQIRDLEHLQHQCKPLSVQRKTMALRLAKCASAKIAADERLSAAHDARVSAAAWHTKMSLEVESARDDESDVLESLEELDKKIAVEKAAAAGGQPDLMEVDGDAIQVIKGCSPSEIRAMMASLAISRGSTGPRGARSMSPARPSVELVSVSLSPRDAAKRCRTQSVGAPATPAARRGRSASREDAPATTPSSFAPVRGGRTHDRDEPYSQSRHGAAQDIDASPCMAAICDAPRFQEGAAIQE
jgi:hypothetical protein